MAKIQLNGKKIQLKQKILLSKLLKKYKLDDKKVAIELNGVIVNKKKINSVAVKNNDKIEIVQFIGGG
ncbi:sulfur carrier protein ThiS [Pelagibacteraceae bacterium]|nr:sulfur carrier protein ThiS [Pelagibacteraceae bacterium]